MESNDIIVAPQLVGAVSLYDKWHKNNDGTHDSFYRFMTTPSAQRDVFVAENNPILEFAGARLTVTIKDS